MTPKEHVWTEPLDEQTVTYHIEIEGQLLLVENVPARGTSGRVRSTLRRRRLSACNGRCEDGVGRFGLLRHRSMSMGRWPEGLGDFGAVLQDGEWEKCHDQQAICADEGRGAAVP